MLAGRAVFKDLIKVLETMDACLHGDLVRVHQNVILDEPERHLVRVLLAGVQARPRHGDRLERRQDAVEGRP